MGPRRPAARPPEPRALDWVAALLVAQLALVAFLPALRAEFVLWDDDTNFLKNTAWRGLGWAELEWMFTTPHKGQWIPLTWITLGLDYLLWGLQPRGVGGVEDEAREVEAGRVGGTEGGGEGGGG